MNSKLKILENMIRSEVKRQLNETINTESINNELSILFDKLVPRHGPSDTVEGEMIRAINRIIFRYRNDGDVFFLGYGKETTLPSVTWLLKKSPIGRQLSPFFNQAKSAQRIKTKYGVEIANAYSDEDQYQNAIYRAAEVVIKYVKSKNGQYTPNTDHDSR